MAIPWELCGIPWVVGGDTVGILWDTVGSRCAITIATTVGKSVGYQQHGSTTTPKLASRGSLGEGQARRVSSHCRPQTPREIVLPLVAAWERGKLVAA